MSYDTPFGELWQGSTSTFTRWPAGRLHDVPPAFLIEWLWDPSVDSALIPTWTKRTFIERVRPVYIRKSDKSLQVVPSPIHFRPHWCSPFMPYKDDLHVHPDGYIFFCLAYIGVASINVGIFEPNIIPPEPELYRYVDSLAYIGPDEFGEPYPFCLGWTLMTFYSPFVASPQNDPLMVVSAFTPTTTYSLQAFDGVPNFIGNSVDLTIFFTPQKTQELFLSWNPTEIPKHSIKITPFQI